MSELEYEELCNDYRGLCTHCGEEHDDNIEPDAYNLKCEHCGRRGVCGAENLILNNRITFSEEA